ncbi:RsmB/NOP family class I SAM-dependent RNA methyltransferase [Carboxydothermus ferrireducens]|uniref:NOL1/NOP2/sun family putative RNA methylase n=1 Tax=Carboxydothermus ferrireducens DSM 11255 TaxID=1119529 RepID=A0ABX2RCI9_9THEO|nr:RsmB/NOP family class I SAM-dependent RNA methyltransferase [Carboxydothermus ferrireducens]NYE58740.1 NOL1/NOP2/sun family putative RNA methylase [Carboxydothermus ferrireducens DSM 11255]
MEGFWEKYQTFLGNAAEKLKEVINAPPFRGLRINPEKISEEDLYRRYGYLETVPWCPEGYYLSEDMFLGKDPWHWAGAFYLQEPSAMLPVEVLDPKPGDKVLDLAAAPGGKSTQILSKLKGEGILVANEVNSFRAKVLTENLERWGYENFLVLNESPPNLEEKFEAYFDRILVDAPCSGEGMFRKNPKAIDEWSIEHVLGCSVRQKKLLTTAAKLLKEGGVMVYSTCTFNPEENERVVAWFLKQNPNFALESIEIKGVSPGVPEWAESNLELQKTFRIWPFKQKGEGHFAARMVKLFDDGKKTHLPRKGKPKRKKANMEEFSKFWQEYFTVPEPEVVFKGEKLFLMPQSLPDINGLKVVCAGRELGEIKKGRFVPSQTLAFSLLSKKFTRALELPGELLRAFIKGESFSVPWAEGWYLICDNGVALGFGYVKKGIFKNQLAKNLRSFAF